MSPSLASSSEGEVIDGTLACVVASFRHTTRKDPIMQLRTDAAYIRTQSHERTAAARPVQLNQFDEDVCQVLSTAHTVKSAAKTLSEEEDRVAASMQRLLQGERIQLSPDS